jgi:excisionase family DNA binding protein
VQKYLSPEEVATLLAVEAAEVSNWIENGALRAYHLGDVFRIGEADIEGFLETRLHNPHSDGQTAESAEAGPGDRVRLETAFGRRAQFRVSGTVKTGAWIWPGKSQSGLYFSREFFERMMSQFQGKELAAGLNFSDPGEGSLGEWIQNNLPTKMNPTFCVAGLLVAEGYAERKRAGVIRFFPDAINRLRQ